MIVALGAVLAGVTLPAAAYASYPSIALAVCNYYTDISDDDDIYVTISGADQNGERVTSVGQFIPKNQCKTWTHVYYSYDYYDYWWKTDQVVSIFNNRTITSGSSSETHPRTDYRRIPASAQNGATMWANLPVQ